MQTELAVTPVQRQISSFAKHTQNIGAFEAAFTVETDLPTVSEKSSAGILSIAVSTTTTTAARDQSQPSHSRLLSLNLL